MPQLLISYDLGTSGAKTTLFSQDGALLASSTMPYDVHYLGGGRAEEDPADWWQAVIRSTQRVLQGVRASDVAAIALSGQMSGALLLDEHMQPVRPHILWSDTRAFQEAEEVRSRVDPAAHFAAAGKAPGPSRMLEKLMWVKRHEPEAYARTRKVINAKDYIAFLLTDRICTDYTDASCTFLFDRRQRVFSRELLELGGIDPSLMPEAVPSTQVIGHVTEEAARLTGLCAGTPVVIGAGDVPASTVGAQCVGPRQMHFCIGSSAWCAVTLDHAVPDQRSYSVLHAVDGLYVNQCTLASAGISYKWLRDLLRIDPAEAPDAASLYDVMNRLADASPAGANGVLFLPYLLGDQSLYNNPGAFGAFLGLRADTARADIVRAVLEGVCCYLAAAAKVLTPPEGILGAPLLLGGAAKGGHWSAILGDMLGAPVRTPAHPEEATSIGAAIIGGVGVGLFPGFEVAAQFVQIHGETAPHFENADLYARRMQVFHDAYACVEPLFSRLRAQ